MIFISTNPYLSFPPFFLGAEEGVAPVVRLLREDFEPPVACSVPVLSRSVFITPLGVLNNAGGSAAGRGKGGGADPSRTASCGTTVLTANCNLNKKRFEM